MALSQLTLTQRVSIGERSKKETRADLAREYDLHISSIAHIIKCYPQNRKSLDKLEKVPAEKLGVIKRRYLSGEMKLRQAIGWNLTIWNEFLRRNINGKEKDIARKAREAARRERERLRQHDRREKKEAEIRKKAEAEENKFILYQGNTPDFSGENIVEASRFSVVR